MIPGTRHAVLELEYLGTAFHGWARQPGRPSIEGALRAALEGVGLQGVELRCAGRTDTGVHATGQVVDVRYDGPVPPENLARALLVHLPRDVAVTRCAAAPAGFDARFHATSRAYEYRVLARRAHAPLRAATVLHHPRALDTSALEATAAMLVGSHDFQAFTPSRSEHAHFRRTVCESAWTRRGDELVYHVRAGAFLRSQVRVMVGTMLAAARGELSADAFAALLEGGVRADAAATAPPRGLCLVDVTYELVPGLPAKPGWEAPSAVPFT